MSEFSTFFEQHLDALYAALETGNYNNARTIYAEMKEIFPIEQCLEAYNDVIVDYSVCL